MNRFAITILLLCSLVQQHLLCCASQSWMLESLAILSGNGDVSAASPSLACHCGHQHAVTAKSDKQAAGDCPADDADEPAPAAPFHMCLGSHIVFARLEPTPDRSPVAVHGLPLLDAAAFSGLMSPVPFAPANFSLAATQAPVPTLPVRACLQVFRC